MKVQLRDGRIVSIRPLQTSDKEPLYHYLQNLSAESRSRFGPHPFDEQTIEMICEDPGTDTLRFIAVDESAPEIIAYMLIKQGMNEADQRRYAKRSQFFNDAITVTYAPSVADAWQSSGLGTAMLNSIEAELIKSLQNPAASTCAEDGLLRILRKYDSKDSHHRLVEEVSLNELFRTSDGRVFKKGEKLRKRYKCVEVNTGKLYLFSPVYEVELV
ncbi:MAG: hypothetical protein ACXWV2_01900 [Chitinophagaceae bacterium]